MSGTPTQIGPYTIDRELGRGGMGVVYLGHDTRLDRKVAIKALPEHFAQEPERLARFEREAKLLASLNHPNIAGVYGFEESGGARHLVMEFVEGRTLAEHLASGPLAADEALRIAAQIAAGVEAAHEAGVIHRDLKPGNIIVTPDGKAKVLDFGLAREIEGRGSSLDLSRTPTMTSPPPSPSHHTGDGQIIGTAAYMSPEQARGRRIDRRTDIWSFGCVLYEMLTGDSPYRGETVTDSLGAILHKEPEWEQLRADTPATVRLLLRRCLAKDPERRLRDIGDARVEIEEHLRDPAASRLALAAPAASGASSAVGVRALLLLVAILVVVAGAASWRAWLAPREAPQPVRRFLTTLESEAADGPLGQAFAVAPDGSSLAFVSQTPGGQQRLQVRRLDEFLAVDRAGTEGANSPFYSPDSAWIGYYTDGRLMKIAANGGSPVTICETPPGGGFRGATWTDDGHIVFSPSTTAGLFIVADTGGKPTPLTTPESDERSHRWPHALPGSNAVLFVAQDLGSDFSNSTIEAVRLADGERIVIHRGGSNPTYARSGHLIFGRSDGVFGARFDARSLQLQSPPVPILEQVAFSEPNGSLSLSVSDDGVLVCSLGSGGDFRSLLNWADREGVRTPVGVEPQGIDAATLSPDGRRIALQIFRLDEGWSDLWVHEVARSVMTRLTFGGGDSSWPTWSPDGREIAFTSIPRGSFPVLAIARADGSGTRTIGKGDQFERATDWLDDGTIVFVRDMPDTALDIMTRPADRPDEMTTVIDTPFSDIDAVVSPDGRWIAYQSNASGRPEVYVRPFPDGTGRWQISPSGGNHPLWSPAGDELFFFSSGTIHAVAINGAGDTLEVGVPTPLFEFNPGGSDYPAFAVHPDGERFLLVERDPTADPTSRNELAVTLNWFRELRERTGG